MPYRQNLSSIVGMLNRNDISSVELVQCFLDRIQKHSDLNAFISTDPEQTLKQAQLSDEARARGSSSDLSGVPIAHKDIFCTTHMATTCGSRMLKDFISPYNATVVELLSKSGAILIGKTNMDEFAMGSSTETSWFGPTRNPWHGDHVPGGSSGGSAAAVAARLVPAATGTDTGGSIRQPAAFCGLTGLKPSYGRISRYGMIAYASSLDQGGPITQTAEDAARLLQVMAGFDRRDATSLNKQVPNYLDHLCTSIAGLRIGVPSNFVDDAVNSEVLDAIHDSLAEFEKLGAKLVEVSLPSSKAAIPCYYVIAPAEASSNLSRFDGVRYGYRTDSFNDLDELYKKTRSEGFGLEVKRRIMIGTFALSSGYYDAYYRKAQQIRRLISDEFESAFKQCDYIAGPTSPTTAFGLGEKTNDPVSMYLSDIFTISANLAGIPAISIPVGFDKLGLPVGLQLIGQSFDEQGLLNLAHSYQQVTNWHEVIPTEFT
ncbi:MAG: Asp-tRNA(Asn)/Glu-tRNA(Gln) amidotransferase GatCAB subunit A [Acidiferrobacteraceae bacterium]|nr:Asp-tRNA(Asn)/Glu-tRNA(Gln) amidotransferase GatCAB subunit A [Acidiferrobacteraceae bacterium]